MDESEGAAYPSSGSDTSASIAALPPSPPVNTETTSLGTQEDVAIGVDPDSYADTDPSALTDFQTTLSPYGTWVEDDSYGTVWVPSSSVVGADFAPYVTAGHWTYEDDWVWVSDYDWGWAPFHYGRWVYVAGRGWCWIPGRTYRGAWVTWRTGYDGWGYIGWAPLPPIWYWRGGYAVALYSVPPAPYVFCHQHDVFAPAVAHAVVPSGEVAGVAAHTRPYVPASPSVNGHIAASPRVNGPDPHLMGIANASITRTPHNDVGLLRAQQFSAPRTATVAGGRAPSFSPPRPERAGALTSTSRFPVGAGPRSLGEQTLPSRSFSSGAYARPSSSIPHISPYAAGTSAQGMRGNPSFSGGSTFRSGYSGSPSYSQSYHPSFSSSPSYSAPSHFSSSPSYSAPSYHSGFSSSPSFHSSPSFSAPTSRPSSSSSHFSAPHVSHGGGRR